MNLITGLLISGIFFYLTSDMLKKYSLAFYVGFYAMMLLMIGINALGYYKNLSPIGKFYIDLFQRGVISTSMFIIIMFIGVFTKHNKLSKTFFTIRGEMSIIACLMALTHNIIFGVVYFVNLFKKPSFMPAQVKIAAIISLILICLMIPLFITSFKCVRKKMKAKSWKRLQRLAYPFFILIYIHVMLLFSMNVEKNRLSIIVYTLVYVSYVVLRLRKYIISRQKLSDRKVLAQASV